MNQIATLENYKKSHSISIRDEVNSKETSVSVSHGLHSLVKAMGLSNKDRNKMAKKYYLQYNELPVSSNTKERSYKDRARQHTLKRSHYVQEAMTLELLGIDQEVAVSKSVSVCLMLDGNMVFNEYTLPCSLVIALNRLGINESAFLSGCAPMFYKKTNGLMKHFSIYATQLAYMLLVQRLEEDKYALAA